MPTAASAGGAAGADELIGWHINRGRAEAAEDLVDATPDEIIALLGGRSYPSAAELAERARWRRETPITAAPPHVGFPPSPPGNGPVAGGS